MTESQTWARNWQYNTVPSGKPAHELACKAIRALPLLFELAARDLTTLTKSTELAALLGAKEKLHG